MSVSGLFSNFGNNNQISSQHRLTSSEFQQLGQDLANGNLTSAQSDFAILQQAFAQPASAASPSPASASSTANPLAQAFQQLSSDLKSGNLSAAQNDYSTLQHDVKVHFSSHRYHHPGGDLDPIKMMTQTYSDLSSTLAQSNATSAQQTYATLAQQLQHYTLGGGAGSVTALSNPISFLA